MQPESRLAAPTWLLVFALLLSSASAASADEIRCSSFEGVLEGSINANVLVDEDCLFDSARVNGNVKFTGSHHLTIQDSRVNGNVECGDRGSLELIGTRVFGNLVGCSAGPDDRPWQDAKRRRFQAALDGLQEVPAVSTRGEGRFAAQIPRGGSTLQYGLVYEALEGGDVRFAHIHFGREGTNGGVIAFLCSNEPPPAGVETPPCPPEGEPVFGEIDRFDVLGPAGQGIDPGEVAAALRALRAGAAYVNVHTEDFPGGEIRGQIETGGGMKKVR